MAKRTRDYSLDHFRLGTVTADLPKEMLDRMRSLKTLYLRNLPQKYRYYKNFKELFYHPKTLATTRAMMIDAAFHRSAGRITDKLNLHAALRNENGRGRYVIDIETDRNGIPRNFAIVFIKSSNQEVKKVKCTPTLRKVLARSHVDPASARITRQVFQGKIDRQRGMKIQTAILEIMKLITMIKLHLEAVVVIHDRQRRNPNLISAPPETEEQWDMLVKLQQKGGSHYNNPLDFIFLGDYTIPGNVDDVVKEFHVQNLVQHCNHYLKQGMKFTEFFIILDCLNKWNIFSDDYKELRDYAWTYGNRVYPYEECMMRHLALVERCVLALDDLVNLSNHITTLDINDHHIYKKLKRMPPSRKIPRAISHETSATWRVDDAKLYIEGYTRKMKTLKERLGKWKHYVGIH